MEIINLHQAVIDALHFFGKNQPETLNTKNFKSPLVVGSGNAIVTGQILFADAGAFFADESSLKDFVKNYGELIKNKTIKEAIIISAKKLGLKTYLLTCSPNSPAVKVAEQVFIYKKLAEPYTYNTSTYLGMILSKTKEDPKMILKFLRSIKLKINLKKYQSYAFILPDQYKNICALLQTKADELFGPHVVLRAFTEGNARHAKFIHRDKKELVISLGVTNNYFGDPKSRLEIKLPKNHNFGLLMMLGYSLIGNIQEIKPNYFKKNIKAYCLDYGAKAYGPKEKLPIIVE